MPHFNGSLKPMLRSFDDVMGKGYSGAHITEEAQQKFTADYQAAGGLVPEQLIQGDRGFVG